MCQVLKIVKNTVAIYRTSLCNMIKQPAAFTQQETQIQQNAADLIFSLADRMSFYLLVQMSSNSSLFRTCSICEHSLNSQISICPSTRKQ